MSDVHHEKALELRTDIISEIDEVIQRVADLQKRLALLCARRDAVDQMLTAWGGGIESYPNKTGDKDKVLLEKALDEADEESAPAVKHDADKAPRPQDNASKEDVWKAARAIIEDLGTPIGRPDMYDYLTRDCGLKIEGANPLTVLSTMLWRTRHHSALKHFRTRGYWTADKPMPELGWSEDDASTWLEELRRERLADGTAYDRDREYEANKQSGSGLFGE